jgi:hypothetical protein
MALIHQAAVLAAPIGRKGMRWRKSELWGMGLDSQIAPRMRCQQPQGATGKQGWAVS